MSAKRKTARFGAERRKRQWMGGRTPAFGYAPHVLGRELLNGLVPERCALCLKPQSGGFCHGCRELLPWVAGSCECCRTSLPQAGVCAACVRRPPPWRRIQAPLRYAEPISGLLRGLKYHRRIRHAEALGALLAEAVLRGELRLPEVLLPIPLHRSRLRERGFNQAALIADRVGSLLDIPVDHCLLTRRWPTLSQTDLDEPARRKNLKNAFAVSAPGRYDAVAVIDDVITSGATMGAACQALGEQGYSRVSVWAVAKT